MTTTFRNRQKRGRALRAVLVGILVLVVGAILVVWRAPLTGVFWFVFEPAVRAVQEVTSGNELEWLRAELAEAEALIADREFLMQENENLKRRLGRVPAGASTMLATILLRPPATPYDTLVLDVGLQQGVAAGDLVFSAGSVVIGRITEVYRSTSRATLLSTPGQSHEAIVFTEGGSVPVVLEGQGGGSLRGQLPQGVTVVVGDEILFPDLLPQLVARVAATEVAPNESFQTVYTQLPINPLLLHYVEVRTPTVQ